MEERLGGYLLLKKKVFVRAEELYLMILPNTISPALCMLGVPSAMTLAGHLMKKQQKGLEKTRSKGG